MSGLTIVSTSVTEQILNWDLAIQSVRNAFESIANDASALFPVQVMHGTTESDLVAVKAGVECVHSLVGFKFGAYWPGNSKRQLPPHSSTTVLFDAETGYPRALVSGKHANLFRTAAADAIAVLTLARTDATVLGVVGAGHQAEYEIRAIAEVRNLSMIKIFTRSQERGNRIMSRLSDLELDIRLTSAEEAIRGSDIVATVTPSTSPIVMNEWVEEGTHISAMGADVVGKQELATEILARSRLFADFPQQSIAIGEFQHAFREGVISSVEAVCPIGSVTQGVRKGRTREDDVTVFDSSGVAIQDLCIADTILQHAIDQGLVASIDF